VRKKILYSKMPVVSWVCGLIAKSLHCGLGKITFIVLTFVVSTVESRESIGSHECRVISTPSDEPIASSLLQGGPLVINPTFNANITAAQRAVIQQAINEWEALIPDAGAMVNPYPMTFLNGPVGGLTAAIANTTWNAGSGTLVRCTITIDNDGTTDWWVDPTPGNDSEFDGQGNCEAGQPCVDLDLLTAMRHEIGHGMGWAGMFGNNPNPLNAALITGNTFDAPRLNIAFDPTPSSHADGAVHVDELMNPSLNDGHRKPISLYPGAALVARGINHGVTMEFVDENNNTGTEDGTADNPWNTIEEAVFCPEGAILFIPGTYVFASPSVTISLDCKYFAARGGNAVITAQ